VSTSTGIATFAVTGELTIQTAAEHKTALLAALSSGGRLDVDLSGVTELDTAGLQVLLLLRREALEAGSAVRLLSPSAAVADVLRLARIDWDAA
jgi:anti-anti-sigma factor